MTRIERLKNSFLWIIRWMIYPLVLLLVMYLISLYNQYFLGNLVWWIAIPIWGCTSVFATLGVAQTGLICPNRKFGNFFFLGIFLIIEIWSFTEVFRITTALEMILRIWADLTIIIGFIIGATTKSDQIKIKP